jgi:hypothetical protein
MAVDVGSMDIVLSFDPDVLTAKNVVGGDLTACSYFESMINIDNVSIALVDDSGINGNGTIANITFEVIGCAKDERVLILERVEANDIDTFAPIPVTKIDAVVSFVYGIFPSYGCNFTKNQLVTVYGFGFTDGVIVELTKEGEENIEGEGTEVLSNTRFITNFNLTGKETGWWDAVVTFPHSMQAYIPNAFKILGSADEGYFFQNITIGAGESHEYGMAVPETDSLFVTLQKPHS